MCALCRGHSDAPPRSPLNKRSVVPVAGSIGQTAFSCQPLQGLPHLQKATLPKVWPLPRWLTSNDSLIQEYKNLDISAQPGNILRGIVGLELPVELAESIAGSASQFGFSLYPLQLLSPVFHRCQHQRHSLIKSTHETPSQTLLPKESDLPSKI